MCKNKKGFTLIEILAVIIVLAISFKFISPEIVSIINSVKDTETKVIEEKVLSSAKEYINNVDNTFYTKLIDVGDTSYIYKSDLINSGLLSNEEVNTLNNFTAVKGELLENDKIKYTLEYINVDSSEYTNEELYFMYENLTDKMNTLLEETLTDSTLNGVRERLDNLTDISNTNNIFLKNYPVGSVYMSSSSTNPGTIFGGTWVQIKDTFLLGAGDSYTAGSTGGEASHTLTVNEMPSHNHGISTNAVFTVANGQGTGVSGIPHEVGSWGTYANAHWYQISAGYTGGSAAHNNMPPYLTVYMWKRTA